MAILLSRGDKPQFKWRPSQFEQGQSKTLPGPYAGLNLRDDITALDPNEARVLDNWRAKSGNLVLRPGYEPFVTSVGIGEVPTLAAFSGLTALKMVAASDGKIFDVTSAGAATQLATGFTSNRWQTGLYNNRLQLVNGADAPQVYNGSTVGAAVWSGLGLTATNLVNVAPVRNRLWFCESNAADVWYGEVGSIAGNLKKFQLSQIASGGTCMAIGSWSRDAGDGADDLTVFVMSTGEIIVYQGDAGTSFELVGKYPAAPPIGRRCLFKVGGELVVITRLGLLPVSAAMGGVALDLAKIDPWGKIAPGFAADAVLYGNNAGWHGVLHEGVVYINVPTIPGVTSKQWVLDTRIGVGAPAGPVGAGGTLVLQLAGPSKPVPAQATAVVFNLAATEPQGAAFVTVYPDGEAMPTSSSLNIDYAGQTVSVLVTASLGNGAVRIYSLTRTHLVADLAGYGAVVAFLPVQTPTEGVVAITVVEGRLVGTNPYGQPGVEAYKQNMMRRLRS